VVKGRHTSLTSAAGADVNRELLDEIRALRKEIGELRRELRE